MLDWELGYPRTAIENEIGGTVTLDFIIEADGTTSNINVSQCLTGNFDKQIMRVVSKKWVQGRINFHRVPVSVHLQVTFEIIEKGYRKGDPECYNYKKTKKQLKKEKRIETKKIKTQ